MSKDEKGLRTVVFLTGFFEFGTSFLLLFFPGVYEALFNVPAGFDRYYIRQIGMFEFLVGSFILYGAFDRQLRPFALMALWFHVACLPFEFAYAVARRGDHGLFDLSMWFFVVFHIVMLSFLIPLLKKNQIKIFDPISRS